MSHTYLFTSESVSEGHPDKVADRIADAILDAYLAGDPYAKVACETLVTENLILIAGETFSSARVDIEAVARQAVRDIGYTDEKSRFNDQVPIQIRLHEQAAEIRRGVEHADGQIGAGDQGLMFGYACNETPELMPLPIMLAHRLMRRQSELWKKGVLPWLRPDAKSQVTVRYINGRPACVETVVLSTQHTPDVSAEFLHEAVVEEIIKPAIPEGMRSGAIRYLVNPTGSFTEGGPSTDTGLTGRKIIVDTYGASCPHGGGAFSGKDPTKVDRSAAYAARYIARNIVASGLAEKCMVQLSYAIGLADPTSIHIDFRGTGRVKEFQVKPLISRAFPVTPGDIIKSLELRRPIYAMLSAYGHFGRTEPEISWEHTDEERIRSIEVDLETAKI